MRLLVIKLAVLACAMCGTTVTAAIADWLIDLSGFTASIESIDNGKALRMTNGLVSRTIRLAPNAATVSFRHEVTGTWPSQFPTPS